MYMAKARGVVQAVRVYPKERQQPGPAEDTPCFS